MCEPKVKKPKKPTIPKPKAPSKPKIGTPAKESVDAVPTEVLRAFDAYEGEFYAPTTTRSQDSTIVLTSPHGYFRVYKHKRLSQIDEQIAIFFFNKRSKKISEIHGTIARKYLDVLPKKSGIQDFPIRDELATVLDTKDRISCLSRYSLTWNHSTNKVERKTYNIYKPTKVGMFIACTQEFDPGIKDVNYSNWRDVNDLQDYKDFKPDRKLRPTGMPTQVLLHETAGQGDMVLTKVEKDGATFLIPHFCINNIDSNKKGNIIQYVDIAERTSHGVPLNDRSVGIELVNAVFEAYDKEKKKIFKLDKSVLGIFLKTSLTGKLKEYFLPLEFYPAEVKTGFTLTIPEADLINSAALAAFKVGPSNEPVAETKSGVVTIKNCKSEKFEHLLSLVRLLQQKGQMEFNLDDKEQHRNVYRADGKEYFLYEQVWVDDKKKVRHFAVDIRLPGIFAHGLTGNSRYDGYAQALYLYLRRIRGMSTRATLQRIIDLLVESKAKGAKRATLDIVEKVALVSGEEVEPNPPIKIKVSNYLEIT